MRFGAFEICFLSDGTFKLDGGAMFGIVPKPLWSKERPADERNRILLSCNCPLIRTGKHNILIDCGLGRKWNAKQREIYAIDEAPRLIQEIHGAGLKPEDITIVINTHLHLDHAGWNSRLDSAGNPVPVFVNARHIVERRELEVAHHPNELQRGTYLSPNVAPLDANGSWDIVDDTREIVPGITVFRTGGHTAGYLAVRIESEGQHALFLGEIMPTTTHRHLPWMMSYDNFPVEMLEVKRRMFSEAVTRNALLLLNHDATAFAVRLKNAAGDKLEAIKEY